MSIWNRFLYLIGKRPTPCLRIYEISESLQVTLSTLAQYEGRPEHELVPDLLAAAITCVVKIYASIVVNQDVPVNGGVAKIKHRMFEYFRKRASGHNLVACVPSSSRLIGMDK